MDASLLTHSEFWTDSASPAPGIPELAGHVLFETSGSSGVPKWVAISKQALLISAAAVNRHLDVTHESRWGLALPLNHVGGFGVAARAYEAQCGFHEFGERWHVEKFHDWLESCEVSHTSLVPTQVHDLVRGKLTAPTKLQAIVVGGGRLDETTGQTARDLGWPVLASYGMTEASSQIATQTLASLTLPYRCSPIPLLPIWEAKILSNDLLSISGPALFSGYVSGGRFFARSADWHATSDRATLTNREISPLGRADSLVKILGELVDPEEIERDLISQSQGRLSPGTIAVIAIPDERAGCALVPIFDHSVDPQVFAAILAHFEQNTAGFKRLKPAVLIENFPRSELGKLRRGELSAILQK